MKASQFLSGAALNIFTIRSCADLYESEELPVRLAHRVKELDELPHNLSMMPSIKRVKNWYAQSFEVYLSPLACRPPPSSLTYFLQELITCPAVQVAPSVRQALMTPRSGESSLPESIPNPTFNHLVGDEYGTPQGLDGSINGNGNGFNKLKLRVPMEKRYELSLSRDHTHKLGLN